MSKTRQAPDGPVWVRTYPVTFLHDVTDERHKHDWHQLTFAIRGHLEVITDDARRIVPADRAVWVPAGVVHTEVMRAPISMRSIYIARIATSAAPDRVRTIAVTPLLRELVLHITRIGALDRRNPEQARLVGVLFDQLALASDVPLELRSPIDPRARRLAEILTREPGNDLPIAKLARSAGASLRTIERYFVVETGMSVGEWRRRVRLFHAMRLLEKGAAVTNVAGEVGYDSPSAFTQAFAREFGRLPKTILRNRERST
ncbi:MAG TPA: helix-turn-helix transcriptional regulator [Kofleriaceae bacterium]|nr:helix-turn-helix transcriptional regulator [Kofleriaceae bacterium]